MCTLSIIYSLNGKETASRFNLTYRYMYRWCIVHKQPKIRKKNLGQVYPAELEIKDTTESITFASYLDLLHSIGRDGKLHNSIYDKQDDFNFHITNFPFLSSSIFAEIWHFTSQLIRHARACSSYECLILSARRLSSKLLKTWIPRGTLKIIIQEVLWSIRRSYSVIWSSLSRMVNDSLTLDQL